jgi:hypothetical protein
LVILLSILFLQLPSFAKAPDFTAMTINLFIGAEIQSLADAPDLDAFLEGVEDALDQMAANDFTERAEALAALIVEKNPHLIGLQEVYDITSLDPGLNGSPPFLNYLDELKEELSAQGACYDDVATVINLDFGPIPLPSYGPVSITDRDVILARCGVETQVVNPILFCPPDRQSMDGCNYQVVAVANTPVGPIAFQRGYVSVDTPYGLFFNTHLEVRFPDSDNSDSAIVQAAQAFELISVLNALGGRVIVVGDINSSPEHSPIFSPVYDWIMPPYMQFVDDIVGAGYEDAWTLRPGKPNGFTCCYDEDLSIAADLYERIDMVFSNELPSRVKANVVGNDEAVQTPSGLWPSDHAGVVVRMNFAPAP